MGYRRIPTIYTLDSIEGEPGLIVRMKGISFGKIRSLLNLMDDDSKDQQVMDEIAGRFVGSLVSWNLEDEDGLPVPTTLEGVDAQDYGLILKVVNTWLDRITGVGEELGKGSSSGEKFPGLPLTMEAL